MKTIFLLTGGIILAAFLCFHYLIDKPRVLTPEEVPIAFWAWRNKTPKTDEVQKTFSATNAKTLFLHNGQFDIVNGAIQRIRPVLGIFPHSVETHVVYNGTRRFFGDWDRLSSDSIAETIANTYQDDLSRAYYDKTTLIGLQLDFDVPTRLLPMYAETLQKLRVLLPSGTKLSITGLATWIAARELEAVLTNVDFWIPQCYGTAVPMNINELIPISSPLKVGRIVAAARKLNKPFYAGLSAYGYAILYKKDGSLLEMRGDIEPASAIQNSSLELIDTRSFQNEGDAGEIQYVYRAKSDLVLDGLIIQTGEMIVFDVPSAASLMASANAVRENAGDMLLGICLFRLPTSEDSTSLTAADAASALLGVKTKVVTKVNLEYTHDGLLKLRMENQGSASTLLSADALVFDLSVPPGSVRGVSEMAGFDNYEMLCGRDGIEPLRECSVFRANVIRLKARSWKPNSIASIFLSLKSPLPASLPAKVITRVNDGRVERESLEIQIQTDEK